MARTNHWLTVFAALALVAHAGCGGSDSKDDAPDDPKTCSEETVLADCAAPADECQQAACVEGSCVTRNKPMGADCGDSKICDANGECVVPPEPIVVDSDITADARWTTGNFYDITTGVTVDEAATLTIEPNVVIRFGENAGLTVEGALIADGQSDATPIVFTSSSSTSTSSSKGLRRSPLTSGGEWRGIILQGSGSLLEHCQILNAGQSDTPALEIRDSATVRNCVIAHHRPPTDKTIQTTPALQAREAKAGTIISENLFYDNMVPMEIGPTFSLDDSNRFETTEAGERVGNRHQAIVITGCGSITSVINWAVSKVPFVVGNPVTACNWLEVDAGASLTLGDGVIMKFFRDGEIEVAGTLKANATTGITFTAYADDLNGGDTNADADGTEAFPGAWDGIEVREAGSVFNNCRFLYAGGGAYDAKVPALKFTNKANAKVTNSVFAHHRPSIVNIEAVPALDASEAGATSEIKGNTFYDNVMPLGITTSYSMDNSNRFSLVEGAETRTNKFQAVRVDGCGEVTTNITWGITEVPMLIGSSVTACDDVTISSTGVLELADGAILKFFNGGGGTVEGRMVANATDKIVFTSWMDDSAGGDTNGDGAATSPSPGAWWGIEVRDGGAIFRKCHFLYAGAAMYDRSASALVVKNNASITVTDSVFAHTQPQDVSINAPAALEIVDASETSTEVTRNRFFNNSVPFRFPGWYSIDNADDFDSGDEGNPMPNKFQAVVVGGSCARSGANVTWSLTKVPFVIGNSITACDHLDISEVQALTIGAGVILKFFKDGSVTVEVGGSLVIDPTAKLTSIHDDTAGGDTNANGSATTAAACDWWGVERRRSPPPDVCDASEAIVYDCDCK